MKTIIYFLLALTLFQSCVYYDYEGRDGRDGDAFFKINWEESEPYLIDAGGVIPTNFYYDTYYKTNPGYYVVYYEYEYFTEFGRVIEPYEIEVEVFNYEGEDGDRNYDGKDGDDVYFELVLFPDGYDYYHQVDYKSEQVNERTLITRKETILNGKRMVATYYKLPAKK